MFIKHSIVKPWVICEPGDPIEIISARDKTAIIIKGNNERLTVSQEDITDTAPPLPKAPAELINPPAPIGIPPKKETVRETPKHSAKPNKVTQPTIF